MDGLLTALLTGIVSFAATNTDDIFLLLLFSQVGDNFRNRHLVAGQYLGFGALIALSVLGSLGVLIGSGRGISLLTWSS